MQVYTSTQLLRPLQTQPYKTGLLIPSLVASDVYHTRWNSEHSCCSNRKQLRNAPERAIVLKPAATSATPQHATTRSSSSKRGSSDSSNWQQLLLDSIDTQQLVKIVLKGKITAKPEQMVANVSNKSNEGSSSSSSSSSDGSSRESTHAAAAVAAGFMPYKQLTVRPVILRGNVMLQFSLLDSRQDITKNHSSQQAVANLQQLLQLPWHSALLQTRASTTTVQISRKGKALVQTTSATAAVACQLAGSSIVDISQQQQQRSGGLSPIQAGSIALSLQHDRVKATPIDGTVVDPFLQRIGLQTADGRIKASMQAKFTQINEFLKLLIHTGELEHMGQQQQQQQQRQCAATGRSDGSNHSSSSSSSSSSSGGPNESSSRSSDSGSDPSSNSSSSSSPVHILDCGCGSAHLTFGTYHYLSNVRGLQIELTGIDTNKALMDRSNSYCRDLGIAHHAHFHTAAIRDYQPAHAPAIVLALHACDTATDEALALGIRSGASVIMSVPCCHKDLHKQCQQQQQQQLLKNKGLRGSSSGSGSGSDMGSSSAELFDPLLSHGILRQRLLDLLTDTFRAHLLRLAGYRTDVVEFVSTDHTPRNLLIRAVKQQRQLPEGEQSHLAVEYVRLKQYWGVTPHLEKLLREDSLLPEALAQLHI